MTAGGDYATAVKEDFTVFTHVPNVCRGRSPLLTLASGDMSDIG